MLDFLASHRKFLSLSLVGVVDELSGVYSSGAALLDNLYGNSTIPAAGCNETDLIFHEQQPQAVAGQYKDIPPADNLRRKVNITFYSTKLR